MDESLELHNIVIGPVRTKTGDANYARDDKCSAVGECHDLR
jgi:hypothetical protein